MPLRHVFLALSVVAIWGVNFVVIKLSVQALEPFLAASLRFMLAAFPALLFVKKPQVPLSLLTGFGLSVGVALYAFLNLALFFDMPAGLASVVLQVQAFFTILFAFLVLKERPRKKQILGAAIAFSGIGLIALQRLEGAGTLSFVLTILAAISWGIANVISKKAGKIEPFGFIVWSAAIAAVPLLALSLLIEGPAGLIDFVMQPDLSNYAILAFLAYPTTLYGFTVWAWLLSMHPASMIAPFTLLVPITGLLSGWLALGESVSGMEIAGGALVIAGLGVTVFRGSKQIPQKS